METTTHWLFQNISPSDEDEFTLVSESQLTKYKYGMFDTVFNLFILPIAFFIGVFGNSSVVYVFCRVNHMRTVTNYYLVSLALADLFVLVFAVPFFWIMYATSPILYDATSLGPIGCKIFVFVPDCAVIVSSLTVAVLTVERYMAICRPMKFKQWSKKDNAIAISSVIWVAAILYKIPTMYFSTEVVVQPIKWPPSVNETFPQSFSYCSYCTAPYANPNICGHYNKSLIIDQILILSIIPFTVTLYGFIVVQLKKLTRTPASSATTNSNRMKQQVVKMLIVTIIIFFICITPFRVLNLLYDWSTITPPTAVVDVSRLLVYTNSAINPIIYNAMSDAYRKSFKEGFSCCFPGKKSEKETKEIHSSSKANNGMILTNNSQSYLKNHHKSGNLL